MTVHRCIISTTNRLCRTGITKPPRCRKRSRRVNDAFVASEILHRLQRSTPHGLLSSKDVAERLGVSQATVARAVAKGRLEPAATTPGGHRRFRPEDIDALATAHHGVRRANGLISSGEAARLLGVSQHTVIRAVHHGRLVPDEITPGGHYRFAQDRILASLRHSNDRLAS